MYNYYLRYRTPGGRVKERFFSSVEERYAFILASHCEIIEWRDL